MCQKLPLGSALTTYASCWDFCFVFVLFLFLLSHSAHVSLLVVQGTWASCIQANALPSITVTAAPTLFRF